MYGVKIKKRKRSAQKTFKTGSNISRDLTKVYRKGVIVRVSSGQSKNNLRIKIYKVILDFNQCVIKIP